MGRGGQQTTTASADRRRNPGERMRQLETEIRHHRQLYYNDEAVISDAEYDALEAELRSLAEAYPQFSELAAVLDEVGSESGGDEDGLFADVRHAQAMLSLDKAHSDAELQAFLARFPDQRFAVWPKFDGVSLSLTYKQGRLLRAVTRGDGTIGRDVTRNARLIEGVLDRLGEDIDAEVRGEVVMHRSDWEKWNQEHPERRFANPRNAVSGTLTTKDLDTVRARRLHFYAYDLIAEEGSEKLASALEELGFRVEGYGEADGLDAITAYIEQTEAGREQLDYEIDGVVIKLADRAAYEAAGNTSHHPRGAIARKLAAAETETRLRAVTWQVGKSGVVAPVGELSPIFLAGTTISRASLHNLAVITERDIRVGDRVLIKRAGDVIPHVIGPADPQARDGSEEIIHAPDTCPSCGGSLEETGESRILVCRNNQCPAQRRRRVEHWVSRAAGDIDKLGASWIERLFDEGLIRRPADLYNLGPEQLSPFFKSEQALSPQQIIDSIAASKNLGLRRALIGWSIPLCSEGTAKRLCRAGFTSVEEVAQASREELMEIDDIGPAVADSIINFFSDPETISEIAALRQAGVSLDVADEDRPQAAPSDSQLSGKTICITGTLSRSRKEMQRLVEEAGGTATGSVSKKTDYLIAGESAGSKLQRAQDLGVPVLSEDEALALMGN